MIMAKILVVDDSLIMRKKLKMILKNGGHVVVSDAANGISAIEEYEKWKPDLVTMDITMPVLDGVSAVKKIISLYPDAKIIMISAINQQNSVFEAIESGAKHYIVKPINNEKVLNTIKEVLSAEKNENNEESDKEQNS